MIGLLTSIDRSREVSTVVSTETSGVKVPQAMVKAARDQYPEVKDMSLAKILRFALALALGMTREQALSATRDARTWRDTQGK